MRPFILVLGLIGFTLADGIGHSGRHGRQGRRGGRSGFRRGRQEGAPLDNYGAEPLDSYGASDELSARDAELAALSANIPGVPGEDYPIYAEVPESGFTCDGQVDGGYYADPEAECQVFHICTAGANGADGALSKYSFLCPNGTIFNQNYFICDWWFNFDCAEAADLYSLNDDIASERDAAAGALDSYGAATESRASYGAPEEKAAEEYAAPSDYDYGVAADYSEAADAYAAPTEVDLNALPVYEEQATYEGEAAAPGAVVEVREGRRFRGGRQGRRGGRRQNRRGGRGRQGRRGFRG